MDGFKTTYKQIQSFKLSNMGLKGDFSNRNSFARYDANGPFKIRAPYNQFNYQQAEGIQVVGATVGPAATNDKWTGFTITPNNTMYSFGSNTSLILKVDLNTSLSTTFGNLGVHRYAGSVLYGDFIYGVPAGATVFTKLNWKTEQLIQWGSVSDVCIGGVLAPNGKIYFVPFGSGRILVLDPSTDTEYYFGSLGGTNRYAGCSLVGPYIYCSPYSSGKILKIDTRDDSYVEFGTIAGTAQYYGSCLGKNNNVYCIPHNATAVLKIDTRTDTLSTFGSLGVGAKWTGGVESANKSYVYGCPAVSNDVLRIDTETDTITLVATGLVVAGKFRGGTLAINGVIYFTPSRSDNVYAFLTYRSDVELPFNFVGNRAFNKF